MGLLEILAELLRNQEKKLRYILPKGKNDYT